MRKSIPVLLALAFIGLYAAQANAAACSSFATITAYNAERSKVKVKFKKGRMTKYFPRVDGASGDTQKVPAGCRSKITKKKTFVVKSTGGRMTMTQVRSNFEGRMLNDPDDDAWLGTKQQELIEAKTEVVVEVRQGIGKDSPLGITTIYLPITEEEKAEIARLNAQAEDID